VWLGGSDVLFSRKNAGILIHGGHRAVSRRTGGYCLACCWLIQAVSKGRSKWAGLIYIASKGLGWAGGSHFEFGMSSSLPLEPELAPCGGAAPTGASL
jgi:hypothetical protein